jgi:chain length determinant protein EpsF
MDFNQFLLALNARRKAFAMVLIATITAAVAVALLVPKSYVSSTTLLVDSRDEQQMSAPGLSARERAGYLQTQIDLITSGKVATKVARDLKLAQKPGTREEFERDTGGLGNIDEWIGANLLRKVKVDTSASSVVTVTYAAAEPKLASDVANGFAKAYMETALALRTEPNREAAEWFEEQLKGLRATVGQAQTRLASYQKEKGLTGLDERGDLESTRVTELNTQLSQARAATNDATTRYKHAQEIIAGGAAADQVPEVAQNATIQQVKGDLARSEARLQEMSTELGPNHPNILRTQSEIQAQKERLSSEMKKVISGFANAAATAKRREDELRSALAAQQERMSANRDSRVELAVLARDVDSSQRAYDAAMTRYMTNKVESRARQGTVAVITPGVEPTRHASPKVGLITGLSVLIGTLLAAGVVFLLETMDRRVRSRSDLESRLAVPTLGRLSKWQPTGGRLLAAPQFSGGRAARALPHPW